MFGPAPFQVAGLSPLRSLLKFLWVLQSEVAPSLLYLSIYLPQDPPLCTFKLATDLLSGDSLIPYTCFRAQKDHMTGFDVLFWVL